jgi:hypothetical protein
MSHPLLIALVFFLFFSPEEVRKTSRGGSATIRTVENQGGRESIVTFLDRKSATLCQLDYSSEDGSHGFHVVKAEWTHDGKFFVWSLESSGGHSPWHHPTYFLDIKTHRIHNLDDYVAGAGIADGEFRLSESNTVKTTMYTPERPKPLVFRLELMVKTALSGSELTCLGGRSIPLGQRIE